MKIIIDYSFFEKELSYIKNKNIHDLTKYVIEHFNSAFYTEAASSTGKYHPDYSLGFAGLYRHTQAAVKIGYDLLQLDMYSEKFSESVKDYIVAALILHDSCKRGVDWSDKYTKHEHPLLVEQFLKDVLFDNPLPKEEVDDYIRAVSNLVKTHMGQWTTTKYSRVTLPAPELEPQQFVHLCDYLASRKYIDIKLNLDD